MSDKKTETVSSESNVNSSSSLQMKTSQQDSEQCQSLVLSSPRTIALHPSVRGVSNYHPSASTHHLHPSTAIQPAYNYLHHHHYDQRDNEVQHPVMFQQLQNNTDLRLSQTTSSPHHLPHHRPHFSSFEMAHQYVEWMQHVDVVSGAENIKELLKMPFNPKAEVSLLVHRIGPTLLLDAFAELQSHIHRTDYAWLHSFQHQVFQRIIKKDPRTSLTKLHDDMMDQTFQLITSFIQSTIAASAQAAKRQHQKHQQKQEQRKHTQKQELERQEKQQQLNQELRAEEKEQKQPELLQKKQQESQEEGVELKQGTQQQQNEPETDHVEGQEQQQQLVETKKIVRKHQRGRREEQRRLDSIDAIGESQEYVSDDVVATVEDSTVAETAALVSQHQEKPCWTQGSASVADSTAAVRLAKIGRDDGGQAPTIAVIPRGLTMPQSSAPELNEEPSLLGDVMPEPELCDQSPEVSHEETRARNIIWNFEDLRMLIGTDLPIFGGETHPCVSLRLTDMAKPINVLTGLDYWLDNLMCNVPEVAMCFHLSGIVQKYERIKTEELPELRDSSFSPPLVKDIAQNILAFLKDKTTHEGHTYWLFKREDDDVVKLYDLTSLGLDPERADSAVVDSTPEFSSDSSQSHESSSRGWREVNPFTVPAGMLFYRMAKNLVARPDARSKAATITDLLSNSVKLLDQRRFPKLLSSAHYHLADMFMYEDCHPDQESGESSADNYDDDDLNHQLPSGQLHFTTEGKKSGQGSSPYSGATGKKKKKRKQKGDVAAAAAVSSNSSALPTTGTSATASAAGGGEGVGGGGSGKKHDGEVAEIELPTLCLPNTRRTYCRNVNYKPPRLSKDLKERCLSSLFHVVEGLNCAMLEADTTGAPPPSQQHHQQQKQPDKPTRNHYSDDMPQMAKAYEAIPLPYESISANGQKCNEGNTLNKGNKDLNSTNNTNKDDKASGIKDTNLIISQNKNVTTSSNLSTKQQNYTQNKNLTSSISLEDDSSQESSIVASSPYMSVCLSSVTYNVPDWNTKLKALLLHKAAVVYQMLSDQAMAQKQYGAAVRYVMMCVRCCYAVCLVLQLTAESDASLPQDCHYIFIDKALRNAAEVLYYRAKVWRQEELDGQEELPDEEGVKMQCFLDAVMPPCYRVQFEFPEVPHDTFSCLEMSQAFLYLAAGGRIKQRKPDDVQPDWAQSKRNKLGHQDNRCSNINDHRANQQQHNRNDHRDHEQQDNINDGEQSCQEKHDINNKENLIKEQHATNNQQNTSHNASKKRRKKNKRDNKNVDASSTTAATRREACLKTDTLEEYQTSKTEGPERVIPISKEPHESCSPIINEPPEGDYSVISEARERDAALNLEHLNPGPRTVGDFLELGENSRFQMTEKMLQAHPAVLTRLAGVMNEMACCKLNQVQAQCQLDESKCSSAVTSLRWSEMARLEVTAYLFCCAGDHINTAISYTNLAKLHRLSAYYAKERVDGLPYSAEEDKHYKQAEESYKSAIFYIELERKKHLESVKSSQGKRGKRHQQESRSGGKTSEKEGGAASQNKLMMASFRSDYANCLHAQAVMMTERPPTCVDSGDAGVPDLRSAVLRVLTECLHLLDALPPGQPSVMDKTVACLKMLASHRAFPLHQCTPATVDQLGRAGEAVARACLLLASSGKPHEAMQVAMDHCTRLREGHQDVAMQGCLLHVHQTLVVYVNCDYIVQALVGSGHASTEPTNASTAVLRALSAGIALTLQLLTTAAKSHCTDRSAGEAALTSREVSLLQAFHSVRAAGAGHGSVGRVLGRALLACLVSFRAVMETLPPQRCW